MRHPFQTQPPHTTSARRAAGLRDGVSWLVLVLLASAGCAGPSAETTRVPGDATTSRGPVSSAPSRSGIPSKASELELPVSVWAARALDGAPEDGVMEGVAGREREYFLEVLERAAKEPRDVSGVVRGAARGLSEQGGTSGALVVVRELWARECCMRRGFLAAGLLGLVEGLEARYAEPVQDVGTATMLEALAGHVDPDVAAAARTAIPYFMRE